MDIIGAKVLSGFLFFGLALFFGWIPFTLYNRCFGSRNSGKYVKLKGGSKLRKDISSNLIQCIHSMTSGVLIATCLLHLLPESLEAVEGGLKAMSGSSENHAINFLSSKNKSMDLLIEKGENSEEERKFYPVAELFIALGFLFVYMFDTMMKSYRENRNTGKTEETTRDNDLNDSSSEEENTQLTKHHPNKDLNINMNLRKQFPTNSSLFNQHSTAIPSSNNCNGCESCSRSAKTDFEIEEEEESRITKSPNSVSKTDVRSLALVMALCVHGFFDGVMLGLQTSVPVVMSLLFALSLHKSCVALSLSLALVKNYHTICTNNDRHVSRLRYLLYIALFALVAPLGLVMSTSFVNGMFSVSQGNDSLVPGCLQAFAMGTFLYVTFTETTGRHRKQTTLKSEVLGHLFLLLGFVLMAGLRAALGET